MKMNCRTNRCNRIQSRRRDNQDGFTLLELIVSMTILSLVTVLIGSGFRLALDSWEKGEAETAWTQRLRVLSMLMSQQLKSAYPYKINTEDEDENEKIVLFDGKQDSIMFVTTLADSVYGGFKWVKYSFKDETLIYNEGILPDKEVDEKETGDGEIIDTDLDEVNFEYFSSDDSEWKESWDTKERLPGAVRIKISNFQPFSINIPMGRNEKQEENEIL